MHGRSTLATALLCVVGLRLCGVFGARAGRRSRGRIHRDWDGADGGSVTDQGDGDGTHRRATIDGTRVLDGGEPS